MGGLFFYAKRYFLTDIQLTTYILMKKVALLICSVAMLFNACSQQATIDPLALSEITPPTPDPREGLASGLFDAGEASWNMELVSTKPSPESFVGLWNSDLAFKENYVIQGNFFGFTIWDVSNPTNPTVVKDVICPASQSDVSVYGDLLFVSGEGLEGRLDCGTQGNAEVVTDERLRGIRIFDISDIENPEYVANVQTCRGSHTHSVLKDPNDDDNVYVYVSGSAPVRPNEELSGCSGQYPDVNPNTSLFKLEVIKVPLDNPKEARIVSSPNIFEGLPAPPRRGLTENDEQFIQDMNDLGLFVVDVFEMQFALPDVFYDAFLGGYLAMNNIVGEPSSDQIEAFKQALPGMIGSVLGGRDPVLSEMGPNQCHDITLYPEIGLAAGACEGYGILLDITDPASPVRVDEIADINFSYWHNATFNNDGSKVMFGDEWGGGTGPKCRDTDPAEWGANALFTIKDNALSFDTYYKIPSVSTVYENCVSHNGSMIPVPGRDIMVQAWYQGGISVFDWTDSNSPTEIAFFDRGPISSEELLVGGSWSAYWYNGHIYSSEIARGLDVLQLSPNPFLTQNEIDAANTVKLKYKNAQGQPMYKWPASFALAKAYVDQLDRDPEMSQEMIQQLRDGIYTAEMSGNMDVLMDLAGTVNANASGAHADKMNKLASTLQDLAQG